MANKGKILFIVQYPEKISPGQRFRIEAYQSLLIAKGYECKQSPFFNKNDLAFVYKNGFLIAKLKSAITAIIKRIFLLLTIRQYNFIFIYREAIPFGPPILEWIITKLFNKKVIFDFDDAIWMYYEKTESSTFIKLLKQKTKVKKIIKWANVVSCGNNYLFDYAIQFNPNVVLNPTCVDTESRYIPSKKKSSKKITIGWTGSFSTLYYIEPIIPVLKKLQTEFDFSLLIICNKRPEFFLDNLIYKDWNEETEIQDLQEIDIGIMPLENNEWSKGKCGFKIIQYLALSIPAVATQIGENSNIIKHGINGYLCNTDDDWYHYLKSLLISREKRLKMGEEGRKHIETYYSINANANNFLLLF